MKPTVALCAWNTARTVLTGPCALCAGKWFRISRIRYARWRAAGAVDANNVFLDHEPSYLPRADFPGAPFN